MLKKLMKYDLKWCFKPLVVFYILALFFSIITRFIESLDKTLMVVIIDKICSGIVIAMLINILINCFMRNWVRVIRNVYKDESYLTHTLPVSKSKIYLSKILTSSITLLVSLGVILLCLAIVCLNDTSWIALKQSLEQSAIFLNSTIFSLVTVLILTVFFEFLFVIMAGILGIIIGHKANNLKIIKSLVSGFSIYMLLSICSLGIIYVSGFFNSDILSIFSNMEISSEAMKSIMLIGTTIYAIYIVAIYVVSNKLLNKGVNVD